jgi:hypothetical protein
MIKRILLTLLSSLAIIYAQAQTPSFKVLATKGSIKITNGTTKATTDLYTGGKIFAADKIVVSEGAYLGLAQATTGKTIEIKAAGTYDVAKLNSMVASQNASVSSKYVNFVAGEMNSTDASMTDNKYAYMKVTGSVERGDANIFLYGTKISWVLNEKITLRWTSLEGVNSYVVTVTDLEGEKLLEKEVSGSSIELDLPSMGFEEKQNFVVTIVDPKNRTDNRSNPYNLRLLAPDKEARVSKEVADMRKEMDPNSALSQLVMATYFGDNELVVNAIQSYEEAIRLEPEVEEFKKTYAEYLKLVVKSEEEKK